MRSEEPSAGGTAAVWPAVLCVGIVCCLLGWVGAVLGPSALVWLGVAGFVIGGVGYEASRARIRRASPAPVDEAKGDRWRFKLEGLMILLGCLALLSAFVEFGQAGPTAPGPVLAARASYVLNSHGTLTEVSRTDYIIAGVSFSTTWHALALLLNLGALYRSVYGENPFQRGAADPPRQ